MELVRDTASDRQFEGFVAEASDTLFRTGYLMTGDVGDAEGLVQETFLRVARRWNQVRAMDQPAAYARRILINLVLHDADRRSRQKAELVPQQAGPSFGTFQLANSLETSAALIDTGSYTCTSTAPTILPSGGALLHWRG